MSKLEKCHIIQFEEKPDARGNLVFIEGNHHIPFAIERVYYLYDVPAPAMRGGHAHKALQQIIIATSGEFTIHLDDGFQKKSVRLTKPSQGLYLCPMVWRELDDFSPDGVCFVLASMHYDEDDYFRDYEEFVKAAKC